MTKEYASMIVSGFAKKEDIDRNLKAMTDDGYQLLPFSFAVNILIFERLKELPDTLQLEKN